MGYQIQMSFQVKTWLAETRNHDPATADQVDEAIAALRSGGGDIGPPLVVPVDDPFSRQSAASKPGVRTSVDWRALPGSNLFHRLLVLIGARIARLGLGAAHQQQHLVLMRARWITSKAAAQRLELERQIDQLEKQRGSTAGSQERPEMAVGPTDAADQLASLRHRHEELKVKEERLREASQRLKAEIDAFRASQKGIEASRAAAEMAIEAVQLEATANVCANNKGGESTAGDVKNADMSSPVEEDFGRRLLELRPYAPNSASVRLLFTVASADTAVFLAVGTENDWRAAGYEEIIELCRKRYHREFHTR